MLDHLSLKLARPLLAKFATILAARNISADQVTLVGFAAGIGAAVAIGTYH